MRPLRLALEGFGAYLERQEVPFDDVELFAITGPTGAGKSTLLDAITFALYKTTPRIGSRGLEELRHPQASLARVELEFSLGTGLWRVVRVVGEENQSRLEYQEAGRWRTHPASTKARELDRKLAELLGMDYEAFTRAILLPQGRFDLFLRGSPKERRETLIGLYGLGVLEHMQERARQNLKELNEKKAHLEGELRALAEASEARLGELRESISQLSGRKESLGRQVGRQEAEVRRLEELAEKFARLESLRRQRENWERAQAEMEGVRQRLERAQRAEQLWPQVRAYREAEERLERTRQERERAEGRLAELERSLEELRKTCDPTRLQALKEERARMGELRLQTQLLEQYGASLHLEHPDPLPFEPARLEALKAAEELLRQRQELQKQLEQSEQKAREAARELEEARQALVRLKERLGELESEGKACGARLEEARRRLEALRLQAGLAQYHAHLRPGAPCPLCQQPVRTLPPPPPQDPLPPLEAEVRELEGRLEQLRGEYKEQRGVQKIRQDSLPRLEEALQAREDELRKLRERLENIGSRLEAHSVQSMEAVREERQRRLADLAKALRQATRGRGVEAYQKELEQEHKALEEAAQKLAQLEQERDGARLQAQSKGEALASLEEALKAQRNTLTALLQEAGFEGLRAVEEARLAEEEQAALQRRLEAHQKEGAGLEAQLGPLEKELQGQTPIAPEMLRAAREELQALKTALEETQRALGAAQAELERLEGDLRRKRQCEKEKAELTRKGELWEKLAQDLRGDRFPDYLLERYQRGLIQRASELVQTLSQNRYTLHLEDNEYKVYDRWTDAIRPVRTLSGGESFMASLALALALSEHFSQGRIGALFLDEGFGTLDAESLEQVAGMLEALPTQGRLVGIVTHVEALAERLPARLQVEKSPKGSRVRWLD
ncbi:SMC family ATPase [Meiothermus sp. QL-1]|uniref:AAA family ATPase n=1 Tax=Meiothermus sp. QL-1 TaxID=2058095 RepID=UPI000E0C2D54|nr:SMC family ATPase [Meiothermus sp. QL-1]RDI95697.1 SMC family ATPase [Meiothermus sp. QL-1]